MKCPTCLSTMICISEIHPVPFQPGRERMDLHCYNRTHYSSRDPNFCSAKCHMGVITEDPKEWVCLEYSFSFRYENYNYYIYSYDNIVDPRNQHRPYGTRTILSNFLGDDMIVLPYFIPLSTGDDMHEKVWDLFHRLRKLVIFS